MAYTRGVPREPEECSRNRSLAIERCRGSHAEAATDEPRIDRSTSGPRRVMPRRSRQPVGEEGEAERIAPVQGAVRPFEKLEVHPIVRHAGICERLAKRDRAEVEEVLVVAARVDPDP